MMNKYQGSENPHGLTSWGVVVVRHNLNVDEELSFEKFCKENGVGNNASLDMMEDAYQRWTGYPLSA